MSRLRSLSRKGSPANIPGITSPYPSLIEMAAVSGRHCYQICAGLLNSQRCYHHGFNGMQAVSGFAENEMNSQTI